MAKKRGQLFTAGFVLFLGVLFLAWGFLEGAETPKGMLYTFSFVFFILAVIVFIYIFFITATDEDRRF